MTFLVVVCLINRGYFNLLFVKYLHCVKIWDISSLIFVPDEGIIPHISVSIISGSDIIPESKYNVIASKYLESPSFNVDLNALITLFSSAVEKNC